MERGSATRDEREIILAVVVTACFFWHPYGRHGISGCASGRVIDHQTSTKLIEVDHWRSCRQLVEAHKLCSLRLFSPALSVKSEETKEKLSQPALLENKQVFREARCWSKIRETDRERERGKRHHWWDRQKDKAMSTAAWSTLQPSRAWPPTTRWE